MNEHQKALSWADSIRKRFLQLIDDRPYVFLNTDKKIAQQYLDERRQFLGLSDDEILDLENQMKVKFPVIFRAYLNVMGVYHGMLFWGSESNPKDYYNYKLWSDRIISRSKIPSFLTSDSVVFLFHQGFSFLYFNSMPILDAPVFKYYENDKSAVKVASSFQQLVEDNIEAFEQENKAEREEGGYYITIISEDEYHIIETSRPPDTSTEKPLLIGDRYISSHS
jgi:hypothetical protein